MGDVNARNRRNALHDPPKKASTNTLVRTFSSSIMTNQARALIGRLSTLDSFNRRVESKSNKPPARRLSHFIGYDHGSDETTIHSEISHRRSANRERLPLGARDDDSVDSRQADEAGRRPA